MRPSRARPLLILAVWGLPAAFLLAQEPATASGEGPTITLAEAVEATLRNDPDVQTAREVVEQRKAELQQARGAFDQLTGTGIDFSYDRKELFGGGLQREKDRRLRFFIASTELNKAADEIQAGFPTAGSLFIDDCKVGQTRVIVTNLPNQQDITICLNTSTSQVEGIVGNFTDINGNSVGFSNLSLLGLFELLDELGAPLNDIAQDQVEFYTDIMRLIARQLRLTADALAIARDRLGDLPGEQQDLRLTIDAGHQFRFRNGLSFTSSLSLSGSEVNYADKPLSPTYGGTVFPNFFSSTVRVSLDIPLGEGLGRVTNMAAELAAGRRLEAAEQLLGFTELDSALATTVAYWNLAGAQEVQAQQELSASYQERLFAMTRELVEADELPATELDRSQANYARALSEVAAARKTVVENRLALFEAMGRSSDRLEEMPYAEVAVPGPSLDDRFDGERFFREALGKRKDLRAAEEAAKASRHIADGAERNLRRQFDLSMNVSYGGIHESLDDRIYDLSGYWKAFTRSNHPPPLDPEQQDLPDPSLAGPSYGIFLRWRIPFGNNRARGQLLQAEASHAKNLIVSANLEREIRLRIEELVGSLSEARNELVQLEEAVTQQEETLASSAELFEVGEQRLIDTLTTESQLTNARVAVIGAKLRIAVLEAQLRFEAGRSPAGGEEADDGPSPTMTLAAF